MDRLQLRLTSLVRLPSGGNNQVYRVKCDNRDPLLVKVYFPNKHESHSIRLETEFGALQFLNRHRIKMVPEALGIDKRNRLGIYTFIHGTKVPSNDIHDRDLLQAADFLTSLLRLGEMPEALHFGRASEACLNLADYWESVELRYQQLCQSTGNNPICREVFAFLTNEFSMVYKRIQRSFAQVLNNSHAAPNDASFGRAMLSPSDFGFHNALRTESGPLVFIDFEYFGWDDPAKLIADFFHHVAFCLTDRQKSFFLENFMEASCLTTDLLNQVRLVYPVVGLKWVLLLLNVCLPEVTERKRFANPDLSETMLIHNQLEKAKAKLDQLQAEPADSFLFS